MRRFESTYRLGEKSLAIPDTFNAVFRDVDSRLHAQEELRGTIEALQQTLIAQAASRIDEYILPALAYIQTIQQGGFMAAPIVGNSAVAFEEGHVDIAIDQELKEIFRPTPYIALVRGATPDDWAVAQVLGYDAEAGVLALDIVAVSGSAGPHEDVIVTATSGSVMAQIAYLAETRAARNAAIAARDSAQDLRDAVDGLAATASDAAGAATAAAAVSVAARDKALRWAEEAEDVEVDGGKYSARHHAAKAAASALAAATFDPGSYYTKAQTYTQAEVAAAISAAIDGLIDGAPGALDTLVELSAALGNDPNFATTVLNAVAAKADAIHEHTLSQLSDASANGRALVGAANYAAMRTLLGLVIGSNVQAYDANTAKLNAAQTWAAAQLFGQIGASVLALGAGTAINCAANNAFSKSVSGNVTFTITNVPASRSFGISLLMTYTSGTVTWPASIKWQDDTAPALTAGKTYIVVLHTIDGGTTWRGGVREFAG